MDKKILVSYFPRQGLFVEFGEITTNADTKLQGRIKKHLGILVLGQKYDRIKYYMTRQLKLYITDLNLQYCSVKLFYFIYILLNLHCKKAVISLKIMYKNSTVTLV